MAKGFFKRFPITSFDGRAAKNVLFSFNIPAEAKNNVKIYYKYVVQDGERPDTIAAQYYGDPEYAWLIYLFNDIKDPYYDWYMNSEAFEQFIVEKYGSVEAAQRKIAYYEINVADESMIATGAYESLSAGTKKYWKPNLGYDGQIMNYSISNNSLQLETNKIVQVGLANTSGIAVGDIAYQFDATTVRAQAEVQFVNSSVIVVNDVIGEFLTSRNTKTDSSSNTATTSVTLIKQLIPDNELIYWKPVSTFDYEIERNELRKEINLVDVQYVNYIDREFNALVGL